VTFFDGGDVVAEVARAEGQIDGEILNYASYQLVRTLAEAFATDWLSIEPRGAGRNCQFIQGYGCNRENRIDGGQRIHRRRCPAFWC